MGANSTSDADRLRRELRRRRKAYGVCRRRGMRALASGSLDDALFWFYTAGLVGWQFHTGIWGDPQIERALRKIATALGGAEASGAGDAERPVERIAHLTSNILDGGGHTEIILAWSGLIEKWGGVEQHLVSAEWTDSTVHGPHNLEAYARMVRPPRLCPAALTPSRKVRWIYERLAEARPDLVVLHVTPCDVISLCAALMLRDRTGARLAYFNHADHVFSLGMSFADRVIEFRREGAGYSVWHRGVEPGRIRFVPLASRSRAQAPLSRADLGVPEGSTISITVAQYYKLTPDGYWDYGKVIRELLRSEPGHYHLLVGHGPESVREGVMKNFEASPPSVAARLLWLGKRTDVDALLKASDFLIESFPLAGGTLKIDAMRAGAPVVTANNARWPLVSYAEPFGEDYPLVAISNEDVLRFSRMLIEDTGLRARCGRRLSERYQSVFSEAAISEALRAALLDYSPRAVQSAARPVYDLLYVVGLNGHAVDLARAIGLIEAQLGHTPAPGYRERLTRLKNRAKESLKYRLRSLRFNRPSL